METPCRALIANRWKGVVANTRSRETTLRRTIATVSVGLRPTRSATHPISGLRAMPTIKFSEASRPISAIDSPRS
jgi:hypothetical protein